MLLSEEAELLVQRENLELVIARLHENEAHEPEANLVMAAAKTGASLYISYHAVRAAGQRIGKAS